MFQQIRDPLDSLFATWAVALVPLAVLLFFLAVARVSAWRASLIGSVVTFLLGWLVWHMPFAKGAEAYLFGALTGIWNVDWITFWGVVLFNTLVVTGQFDRFRRWLLANGTQDVRAQTILFAWAFGALLEGLVGFGYPWAVVAPIMIALGIPDLDALRIAAIANNAPVSYGGLGSPVIALAAVAGAALAPQLRPDEMLMQVSAAVGHIVALLALLPPWILIYLVSGRRGLREAWPLALTGSLGYVAGQFPVAVYLGPYLPDVVGAVVCFVCVFTLLRFWQPRTVLGYGGTVLTAEDLAARKAEAHGLTRAQVVRVWMPFLVLILIVVVWTGPWSPLPKTSLFEVHVQAASSLSDGKIMSAGFHFNPFVGGSAILAAWVIVAILSGVTRPQLAAIFRKTWQQMWGALLVGAFIFGLAFVYNYAGIAGSLAYAFSKIGRAFLIVAPILGWIGVALSGSNTSTNAMFGAFQAIVGRILGFPLLLLPALNTVGAELGKPIAPQTASVGVSTTRFVRNEGAVIRHNFGWTLVLLVYLIAIGLLCYFFFPGIVQLPGS